MTADDLTTLVSGASRFGVSLTANQVEQFMLYRELLILWNDRVNLTAITNLGEIEERHFLDSISCVLGTGDLNGRKLVDVGSGAGFPGIPLKIAYPGMGLTLVESIGKKATFLQEVCEVLSLEAVNVLAERVEVVGQQEEFRGHFDWAVSRAVARLNILVEYLLPLCKVGGFALAQKGPKTVSEVADATEAIARLGGGEVKILDANPMYHKEKRYLVIIKKVAPTPKNYPRRPGKPAKNPL